MRVYHYLEAKWALDDLRRRRLKLSRIDDMNDPYEWKCVFSSVAASQGALEATEQTAVASYSAQCFSRSWNNILMWSHYADRHKGICLGFDVPDECAREVEYLTDPIDVGDFSEATAEAELRVLNLNFGAKYEGWRYEQEIRVNGSRNDVDEETGQHFVAFGEDLILREVIAGARFPMSRRPIEEALKGYPHDVKIVKARRSAEKFEIIVDDREFGR
jgi:hypothetical protein